MSSRELTISSVQPDRDHALLAVRGRVAEGTGAELRQRLNGLLISGARYVVVDLSEVDGCDHAMVRVLANTGRRLDARQGWLRLVGGDQVEFDGFDAATLLDVFTVYSAARARHIS